MEHESDSDTNLNRCARYRHQRIGTRTGGLGNKRTNGDHLNYSIGQNTEKSPGDLKGLGLTQTPERHNQLTHGVKNSEISKKHNIKVCSYYQMVFSQSCIRY